MKYVLALVLALFCTSPGATPFAVGDVPDLKADTCVWDGAGFGPLVNPVTVDTVRGNPATGNRVCVRDVSGALVGTNSLTLAVRDSTSVWGESVAVPFSFTRPAPPAAATGIRLAK